MHLGSIDICLFLAHNDDSNEIVTPIHGEEIENYYIVGFHYE